MDDFEDNSNNSDHWAHKYSNWEQDCIDYVESSPDVESQIEDEKGGNAHKLWFSFQNAACCIAQLYKDHEQHVSLWVPFQNAASSVTALYKDCIESQRKFIEMGFQGGMQRRNKEVLAWAKKRKRHIRREDLIAFLSGRSVPSSYAHHHYHTHHRSPWTAPKQRLMLPNHDSGFVASGGRTPPHGIALARLTLTEDLDSASRDNIETAASCRTQEGDLETFREALALSGIRSSPQQGNNATRRNTVTRLSNSTANYAELNAFITEEFNRHVESHKRSSSSSDVIMDSPTHKRSKLL